MAIAVTVMTGLHRWPIERFEVGPTAFRGEPWRLLTSALPHLDPLHLLFDVYWLWVFATLFEEVLGHVRVLGLIVLFAAGSAAAQYAVGVGSVGLSGVGYGLFAMAWVLTSRDRRFAKAVDARTVLAFGVWFFFCILATYLRVMAIGNMAHASGALLGALVGAAMSARAIRSRVAAGLGVPVVLALSFAGATILRPRVNLSHDAYGSAQLGYQALQAGRLEEAIRDYREAIAMNGEDAATWYNLGIAYESAERGDESVAAFRRLYELDGYTAHHRDAYFEAAHRFAREAQQQGDHRRVVAMLGPIVALDPDDAIGWLALSISYHALGMEAEEREAAAHALRRPGDGG